VSRPRSRTLRLLLLLLALVLSPVLAGCAGPLHSAAPASAGDQLRLARMRYEREDYTDAIDLLKGYVQYRADAPDLDEAHFLLGMCYVQRKEWPLGAGEFIIVISDFADSPRLADAHYWLGICYWRQSRPALYDQDMTIRSIAQWDRFLQLFPDHPKAADAQAMRLAARTRLAEKSCRNGRLYLTLKDWNAAILYFTEVERDYAETSWLDASRVGHAKALVGLGRKDEARALLEEALPSFKDGKARSEAMQLLRTMPATSLAPLQPPAEAPVQLPGPAPEPVPAPADSGGAGGTGG
jgi:outer membrane assembly lipoprotein YfiO